MFVASNFQAGVGARCPRRVETASDLDTRLRIMTALVVRPQHMGGGRPRAAFCAKLGAVGGIERKKPSAPSPLSPYSFHFRLRQNGRCFFREERALAAEMSSFVATRRQDLSRVALAFEPAEEITPAAEAALRQELAQMTGAMGALERAVIFLLLDVEKRVEAIRPDGFRIGEVAIALVAIFPEMTINFVRSETAAR